MGTKSIAFADMVPSQSLDPVRSERVGYIDTWRFIAVSLVILSHYLTGHPAVELHFPWAHHYLNHLGRLGVLIFFCISGFVITNALIREKCQRQEISLGGFYLRRALRILPPLLIYLVALAAVERLGLISLPNGDLIRAASFTCNLPLVPECSWFTVHTWSLAYEEQFYLLFPLGLVLLGFVERRYLLVLIVGAMMVTASTLRLSSAHHFFADYLGYVIYLLTGCVFALHEERLRRLSRATPLAMWIVLLVGMCFLIDAAEFSGPWEEPMFSVFGPLLMGFVVLGTPIRTAPIRFLFERRLIGYLGMISYSVYLWQQLVMKIDLASVKAWIPALVIGVFILAHFSYRYFERPLMRLGRRMTGWKALPVESVPGAFR